MVMVLLNSKPWIKKNEETRTQSSDGEVKLRTMSNRSSVTTNSLNKRKSVTAERKTRTTKFEQTLNHTKSIFTNSAFTLISHDKLHSGQKFFQIMFNR